MANSTRNTKVDLIVVAVLWVVVTAATYWWLSTMNFQPMGASTNAVISDDSFDLLLKLSVPVTTFVLIVIGYSVIRFRAAPDDTNESAPVRSNRIFVGLWVGITAALAVYVIINPGFTGLAALAEGRDAEMTIEVTAQQWNWNYRYVEEDLEIDRAEELVLPVDVPIVFVITSKDVIHSFWIPAFRVKQDAVPGLLIRANTTATEIGDYAGDDGFRVQCAELCGTGHSNMSTTVSVLSQADFDAWVALEKSEGEHG
jgi:cytochrome c oxidase subunit II